MRTGSLVVMRVVEVLSRSFSVRAAMFASRATGLEGAKGGLWCSPVAKKSSPTCSLSTAISTVFLIRSCSLGALPVWGLVVISPTVKIPNCMAAPFWTVGFGDGMSLTPALFKSKLPGFEGSLTPPSAPPPDPPGPRAPQGLSTAPRVSIPGTSTVHPWWVRVARVSSSRAESTSTVGPAPEMTAG